MAGMEEHQSAETMDLPVSTVYVAGDGLPEPESLTATNKDIVEDQRHLVQDAEAGACRLNLPSQADNSADLNLCSVLSSIGDNNQMETAANNNNVEEDARSAPAMPSAPAAMKLLVTKSTKFQDEHPYIKLYHTRRRQRGLMIMFSYSEFLTGQEPRDISCDSEMLKELFSQFNFKVVTYPNLCKEKTLETMKGLSPAGYECVFIVVSSHGYEREGRWDTEFSCFNGGLIPVYEVVDIFNNVNYPELRGVPKVFIFQMCRGPKPLSAGTTATDSATFRGDGEPCAGAGAPRCERISSDVLIAHSTLPGYESVRNIGDAEGSLYMQALCEVFARHAHEYHVMDLFRLVDGALKTRCPEATTVVESWGFGNLHLHPGLVEDGNGNATEMQ